MARMCWFLFVREREKENEIGVYKNRDRLAWLFIERIGTGSKQVREPHPPSPRQAPTPALSYRLYCKERQNGYELWWLNVYKEK